MHTSHFVGIEGWWLENNAVAGSAIEKLCECATEDSLADRGSVVRAARCLLGSVTKVLLLADIVVVKQLLLAKKKVARSLGRLESVSNFTEFVKAFSQFGAEMVELAHLTGDRQVSDSVSFSFPFVSIQTRFSTRYESRSQVNFNILYICIDLRYVNSRKGIYLLFQRNIKSD